MTLTLPTILEAVKFQNVATAALVVKITNNAGTAFRFAKKVMQEDPLVSSPHGAFIEGLLYDISPITHGYDYNSLEYQPARVSFTLSNLWSRVKADSYHRIRVSDVLVAGDVTGLWGQSIQVIWYPGAYSQGTADGMTVFDGTIVQIGMDGDDKLVLQCDEIWDTKHKMLPQRRADVATFRNLPVENIGATLPLVYGPHNEQVSLRGTGFATCMRVDSWKFVAADHVTDSFYDEPRPSAAVNGTSYGSSNSKAMWIYVEPMKSWARSYVGVTFNTNDSGRATALIDPDAAGWDVYIYPTSATPTSAATDGANNVGVQASYDYDTDTKVSVIANATTQAEIIYEWNISGGPDTYSAGDLTPAEAAAANDASNPVAALPGPATALYGFDMYTSKPGGITISSATIDYWSGVIWLALSATIDTATANMIHYRSTSFVEDVYGFPDSMRWHLATGRSKESGTSPDQKPLKIRIRFNGTGWTADSTVVAYIHECRLVFSCQTPRDKANIIGKRMIRIEQGPPGTKARRIGGAYRFENVYDIASNVFGASVTGREHANAADHAAEPWANGDQITNPAGVIESILVDELGFDTGDDLATDTFDVVYNSGTARANVINLKPGSSIHSKDLIDRICYENSLVLYRRRGNTPKFALVEAVGRSTLAATIRRSELWNLPNISFIPFDPTNKITFKYRRLPHDNQFFKSETVTDTTSTTEYGTFEEEIFIQTIANSTWLTAIKNRLITANFFRSRPHHIVEFKTVGCRYADLELGDKIQFEAQSMDQVLMLYGQTWGGVDFIIFEASVHEDGHSFKAVTSVPEPPEILGPIECNYSAVDSIQNIVTGYKFTMPVAGIIERVSGCMFFDDAVTPGTPPNTHTMKAAVYTDVATPALVSGTQTDEVVYVSNVGENDYREIVWTYTGTKPTLAAGDYYICLWAKEVNETTAVRKSSNTGNGTLKKITVYAGSWPATLTSPTLDANDEYGIRVHYTPT